MVTLKSKISTILLTLYLLAANSFAQGDTIPTDRQDSIPADYIIEHTSEPYTSSPLSATDYSKQLRKDFAPDAKIELVMDTLRFLYSENITTSYPYIDLRTKGITTDNLHYSFQIFKDAALTERVASYGNRNNSIYLSLSTNLTGTKYWRVIVAETAADLNDLSKCVVSPAKRVTLYTDNDICRNGTLLFREDFGGNETTDNPVRQTTVPGLFEPAYYGGTDKYKQVLNGEYSTTSGMLQPDHYIILKKGFEYRYFGSIRTSAWHLQTDHTFPDDETRGYFLEVNGAAGKEKIYSTRLDNLCSKSKLTFTAYFANLVTKYQVARWTHADPAFRMEVRDAVADTVIMSVSPCVPEQLGDYGSNAYKNSTPWYLMGFPFEVPDGVSSVEFAIYNDVNSGVDGMDYALDDIEIRRCDIPAPAITGTEGVCAYDTYQFKYSFDGTTKFTSPLQYRWQKLTGEHQWTDRSTGSYWTIDQIQHTDEGYYRLIIGDATTIDNPNCCAISEPFLLTVTDCPPQNMNEDFCPDGTIKQALHFNQTAHANIQLNDIWPGLPYNIYARVKRKTNAETTARITVSESQAHRLVAQLNTNPITDDDWHEITGSFVVPDWTFNVDIDVSKNGTADILIDSVAIRLCAPKITLTTSADALCANNPYIAFIPHYTDDGTFNNYLYYAYEYSADGITWSDVTNHHSVVFVQRPMKYNLPTQRNLPEGWYRASVTERSLINKPNCRASSEPVYMQWEDECPPFPQTPQDEESPFVCDDGTLLFREDFGGNEQTAPAQSQTPVPQMAASGYRFIKNDIMGSSGSYRVVKYGAQNSRNSSNTAGLGSQWHIQDDHTYPNDYTRGYFLEIDGNGSNVPFYTADINVCHEMDLSFSAYVANVMGAENTKGRSGIVLPKVRFIIEDANEDTVIHETITDPIDYSWEYLDVPYSTMYTSSNWHLIGTSFRVPKDVENVRLSIFNAAVGSDGNDFALDDIEIRLCNPQVDILSDNEACLGREYTFVTSLSGDNPFTPPYEYRWQFAKDSLAWDSPDWQTIQSGTEQDLTISNVTADHDGWYRLTVAGEGNLDNTYCRARSNPFHLNVIDCAPPTLPELTVVSPSVVCLDSTYCFALDTLNKSTLTPFNHTPYTLHQSWEFSADGTVWTEVATTKDYCFTATKTKQGYYRHVITYQDKWNDIRRDYDPFYLKVQDCNPPPMPDAEITSPEMACLDSAYCFDVTINNADAIADTIVLTYRWQFSHNGGVWGELSTEKEFCFDAIKPDNACWYRVIVGFLDERWQESYTTYPFQLSVNDCAPTLPQVEITGELEACQDSDFCMTVAATNGIDLLDTRFSYRWQSSPNQTSWYNCGRGTQLCFSSINYTDARWYRVVVSYAGSTNPTTFTSQPVMLTVKDCKPDEPVTPDDPDPEDTRDPEPGAYPDPDPTPDPVWPEDRLFELIVNKYNWLIVCDNTRLNAYFPDNQPKTFQWYKNGNLVPDATEDDYSETQQLNGTFQLHVTLDNNRLVRSNILYINADEPQEQLIAIYNFMGAQIDIHTCWDNLPAGIYIFVYQSGNQTRTEQILIP